MLNTANAVAQRGGWQREVTLDTTGATGTFAGQNVADSIVVQVSGLAITGTAIGTTR